MTSTLFRMEASQLGGGDPIQNYVTAPMPSQAPAEFKLATLADSSEVLVGGDRTHMYLTSPVAFSLFDTSLYRVAVDGGASELIAGDGTARLYGKITLVLPLGEKDAILFGRLAIARIQNNDELWTIPLSNIVGTIMADGAAINGSTVTVVYQRDNPSSTQQINYKSFSFNKDAPSGSGDMNTWPTYSIDWTAITTADPTIETLNPGAVLAAAAPVMDYGVILPQNQSPDGWFTGTFSVVTDVYLDAGKPTASFYSKTDVDFPVVVATSVIVSITLSSSTIVAASYSEINAGVTIDGIALPDLEPGYTEWYVDPYFRYAVDLSPAPPPGVFWDNLRRAVETI